MKAQTLAQRQKKHRETMKAKGYRCFRSPYLPPDRFQLAKDIVQHVKDSREEDLEKFKQWSEDVYGVTEDYPVIRLSNQS